MSNLTASEKKALSQIESEMARKGFDLGDLLNRNLTQDATSAATAGGGASETVAVVGLKIADTVVAVSAKVDGAGAGTLVGYTRTGADDDLQLDYDADPGAGAIVTVLYKKA